MNYIFIEGSDTDYPKIAAQLREAGKKAMFVSGHNQFPVDKNAEGVYCPNADKAKAWVAAGVELITVDDSPVSESDEPVDKPSKAPAKPKPSA